MSPYYYRACLALFFVCFNGTLLMTKAHAESAVANRYPKSIQVSGAGKVSAKPNKADVVLSIEAQSKTAESARQQAAVATTALLKSIKAQGIDAKDIQTRSVALYPNYSADGGNKIVSYQLNNQVALIIRDIDKVSDIIDSAVAAGGNLVRVQGVAFSVDDPEIALATAREKAYANAKAKAEQYAKMAGVSLGSPLHINESNSAFPIPMPYAEARTMKAAMLDRSATPVEVGEQEISVSVEVMFSID
jgi:uncharacterized protein